MILRGLWMLAKGEPAGIKEFGATRKDFFVSLAPLAALPLAQALVAAVQGEGRAGLLGFLAQLAGTLLLPVLVYEFARFYRRKEFWLRAATALNWSFWMVIPAGLAALFINALAVSIGALPGLSRLFVLGLAGLYLLAYRWFLLRAGLGISGVGAFLILLSAAAASVVFEVLLLHAGFSPTMLTGG